jgi:hypothetical protein
LDISPAHLPAANSFHLIPPPHPTPPSSAPTTSWDVGPATLGYATSLRVELRRVSLWLPGGLLFAHQLFLTRLKPPILNCLFLHSFGRRKTARQTDMRERARRNPSFEIIA